MEESLGVNRSLDYTRDDKQLRRVTIPKARVITTSETLRLPPQNLEAESSVLGGILIDPQAVIRVAEILLPEDFYRHDHQLIYEAALRLFENRRPVDVLTLTEELEKNDKLEAAGGASYLSSLTASIATATNVKHYADIVREKAVLRRIISAGTSIADMGYKEAEDVSDVVDAAEQRLFEVSSRFLRTNFLPIADILTESFERIERMHREGNAIRGTATGFADLDNLLSGLQPSNLIILAARPSVGKCVVGETEILNPETGKISTIEEVCKRKSGKIITLDKNWGLKSASPSNFVSDGIKKTFRVKTALGREIEATAVHPLLTVCGWKKVSELKIGDRVAVPKTLPFFGNKDMPDWQVTTLAYFITDGCVSSSKGNPSFTNTNQEIVNEFVQSIKQFGPLKITRFDSNGTRAASFSVSVNEEEYRNNRKAFGVRFKRHLIQNRPMIRQAVEEIGLSASNLNHWANGFSQPSRETYAILSELVPTLPKPTYFVGENAVTLFLKKHSLWEKNAHEKEIPRAIFSLNRKKVALFLNRLFACDGTAYITKSNNDSAEVISFASVSKPLARQVQHLLTRFGILSRLRERQNKYNNERRQAFEVDIRGRENVIKFINDIGIFGKTKAINELRQSSSSKKSMWTKDTIPIEIWDEILKLKGKRSWRSIYQSMGYPLSHNIHVNRRAPRRETVAKIAAILGSDSLKALAMSEICFDRIVSIEPTGSKPVYDLTVDETSNFVANDIIVHNTSLALNIAEYAAIEVKKPVAVFSLEMSREELVDRMLCSQSAIDLWKLRTGRLTDEDFGKISYAMGMLSEAPLYIDDSPMASAMEIRAKARRLTMELNQPLGLIVIDYLQLLHSGRGGRSEDNRVQEVSEITRGLKALARDLEAPVLALSQLSRAVESRPDKRPQLSDLRESGSIEQDADVVMFIYREDVYDKESENKNIAEILVRKHRNGPTGDVKLYFRPEFTRFMNLEKRREE